MPRGVVVLAVGGRSARIARLAERTPVKLGQ